MSSINSTSSSSSSGGNKLRITGMESGLDVDATVKKMMTAEQTKLDKAKQDKEIIEWKQDAYQDIIKDMKGLQSSFFDTLGSDKNILSANNFAPYTVTGVGTSTVDTSAATFTPGVGTKTGKYTVKVDTLAEGAGVSKTIASGKLTTKLTDIDASLTGNIKLILNTGSSDISISLNNTGTSTLGDLISAINNQSSGSVKASFSELTGEFKLSNSTTGSDSRLTIKTGTTGALSNAIGTGTSAFGAVVDGKTTADGTAQEGKNAKVFITPPGGSEVTVTDKTSNNFTIDGMNYNLSGKGEISVNIGADTQKVYDKIKDFVDKYNTIVDKIQTKLTEKKDSSYKPLTDSERESMSDTQITAWETKAKVGILRNDNNLQTMLNSLRSAFTTGVENAGLKVGQYSDNSIGIDTSLDYLKPGHIDIADPSKLKAAIATNGEQVLKMFTNKSITSRASDVKYDATNQQYKEDGIFTRVKKILEDNVGYTNTTLNSSILTSYANKQYDYSSTGSGGKNTIPDQIYKQQLLITKITNSMATKQEQYYKKFSQLETAMTTLNAQQSQLSSMLGS